MKPESASKESPLLEVEGLSVTYESNSGLLSGGSRKVEAVKDVSFQIEKGTTVGLVGESGSGKSTLGKAILKMAPIVSGVIRYKGEEISSLAESDFRPYRKRIQTIFQDPYGSMNPRMNVGAIVAEPLMVHNKEMGRRSREERVAELLRRVGLPGDAMRRYPHQFSGGQRQRICIARALSSKPEFIICDECVSALDVSVQAQIVNLLQDIQQELGVTYLFIAHDLAVVEHISQNVLVMSQGQVVEQSTAGEIYANPRHEYTKRLLGAVPVMPTILKSNALTS